MSMDKHVVYVPEKVAEIARNIALEHAGGVTLSPGHHGYWLDPHGRPIRDDITLVTVFETGYHVRDLIVRMLAEAGEQAIAYETNGVPHLVDAREVSA